MATGASLADLMPFHKRLNPRLWQHRRLHPEIRDKLLRTAVAFYRFLELPGLRVNDVIVTGSNAAFNYTRLSDIDVHLLVDFAQTTCPVMADNFFTTKKTLWNQTYDIEIHGHPLELYVEDTDDPVRANGIYSVLREKWLKTPTSTPPKRDDTAVELKTQAYVDEIDSLLSGAPKIADINKLLRRLYVLRQNGLLTGGEFSVENLTFKTLRALGYLQKLRDFRVKLRDDTLSLGL
jgi:predicted nucleotidyltransferase